jgi:hypothetical protein
VRSGIRLAAATGGFLLFLVAAPAALAYEAEVAQSIVVTPPSGTLPCGAEFPVSATILDSNGQPIVGAEATWTLVVSISSKDAIVEVKTTTDANGVATTHVWLDCVVGERQVEARVGNAVGGAVLGITSQAVQAGGGTAGLPDTSTPHDQTPPLLLALAGAAMLTGGVMGIRTIVAQR